MSPYPIVRPLLDIPADWLSGPLLSSSAGRINLMELRQQTLRIAAWLRERQHVRPGDRVAICLPKSLEAVQIIYGILAAGAAYVPLQFQGPPARLGTILRSIEPRLLITTAEIAAQAGGMDGLPTHILAPASDGRGLAPLLDGIAPASTMVQAEADDLAAVFFTSGSTGEPKGVMLSHRNMLVSLEHVRRRDGLSSADSEISHTRLHYSSHDLMHPLAIGSRMFLLSDREAMFPEYIGEVMEREGATVWRSTATALRLLLEAGEFERRDLRKLRLVRSFGERFSVELLQRLRAALPQTRIGTSYGATEAYGMASLELEPSCDDRLSSVPLGSVADSYKLSLCDDRGNEVAPGEIGEICVAGPMVMLGYWSDPELTAARRLPGRPDSFRTGDLGHVGEDGLLYLTGRKDHMVKLRGHRFDLGEIEAVLKRHPGVRDAVAFLFKHDGNNPEVRAAILAEQGPALQNGLKVLCAKNLPVYARPARFLVLNDFPMLPTAKIDRQALQALLA